ncbi:hypothetical protein WJX72_007331 [[Myrmecia] bisecta]|uniref:Formamidopyrimidine-DNA glycosylase catalytic domain-containing protein n=1 Tax=[Myrmecia] bisecta TaxID=41462 RepID=A0AAW1Q9F7_9CHLO
MPELPEVEAARRLCEKHCKGATIQKAVVAIDDKVIEGIESAALEKALQGQKLTAAHRKGKHLWFELNHLAPCLLFHFGMTGSMRVEGVDSPQYQTFSVDESQWPPRFWKVQLEFDSGVKLAFCDARRFARVRLQADPLNNEPLNKLGFDPLLSMPSLEDLAAALKKQRRVIKALLLDQGFSAGVGNWVADEVLYQARIHPEQPAATLAEQQVEQLHHFMQHVPQTAVDAGADSAKMPADWLFHRKWDQRNTPKIDGHPISFSKVGGRTTAFVPALQKLPAGQPSSAVPKARKRKADDDGQDDEPAGHKAAAKHGKASNTAAGKSPRAAEQKPPAKKGKKRLTVAEKAEC